MLESEYVLWGSFESTEVHALLKMKVLYLAALLYLVSFLKGSKAKP